MSFAVICKSCQARFLLNDDLLRRKVAGRVVTVRCRQCHATIEVDGSDVDPTPPEGEGEKPKATTKLMFNKPPRPAPAPPRPAKATLMGIGVTRPAGATELVALSPGLLGVETETTPARASRQGFPEPPPPPSASPASVEELDANDWEVEGPPTPPRQLAAPVSLDDFVEELPPSIPPRVEDELPSSTGTPSLKSLTHHDGHATKPLPDDFLANMSAAMNGGIMTGAPPTIDVSQLTVAAVAPPAPAPGIDLSDFELPARGAQTLALFEEPRSRTPAPSPAAPSAAAPPPPPARHAPGGSLKPVTADPPALELQQQPESTRERKHVVAPSSELVAPKATGRRSGLAAPLLVALAAVAAFLIWKRNAAQAPPEALARAERGSETAAAQVLAPTPPTPAPAASEAPLAKADPVADDVTFETTPTKAPAAGQADRSPPPAAAAAAITREPKLEPSPKPEPAVATEPVAEPTPATPAEPAGPFDRAAAAAALSASASQASACRKDGDPSGVASVVVTFAPSGRVTSATIGGPPFAGTPTGGCIAATLRKSRIPAFDGERVTVS
ncbi:MAG TPA: MJ0042-type zinc finger domain-containing protein, partial [Polyangiaceae bacterium]